MIHVLTKLHNSINYQMKQYLSRSSSASILPKLTKYRNISNNVYIRPNCTENPNLRIVQTAEQPRTHNMVLDDECIQLGKETELFVVITNNDKL